MINTKSAANLVNNSGQGPNTPVINLVANKVTAFATVAMLLVAIITLPMMAQDTSSSQNRAATLKNLYTAQQTVLIMEALEEKCELTSNGLAKCFEKRFVNSKKSSDNVLKLNDGAVWAFTGNGSCLAKGDCSISISGKNFTKAMIIPLYVKEGNYIEIKTEDINNLSK